MQYDYLFNGHGDVVQLTGSNGNVVKTYDYDSYGNEKNPDQNDTNAFRYSGEYFDKETGNYYLSARYYNPVDGRFISEDSYTGQDNDPLSLNLYTYCEGDPVNYSDPSGHGILDIGFLLWDAGKLLTDPSWENAGMVALDAVCLLDPTDISSTAIHAARGVKAAKNLAEVARGVEVGKDLEKVSIAVLENSGKVVKAADEAGAIEKLAEGAGKAVESINPNTLRFSQNSVNNAGEIIDSMKANGWQGAPIDVVRMPDGALTSIDNTRVLASRYAGIDAKAVAHDFDSPLPASLVERFTTRNGVAPQTWGEAITNRIGGQNSLFRNTYPYGSNLTGWGGK